MVVAGPNSGPLDPKVVAPRSRAGSQRQYVRLGCMASNALGLFQWPPSTTYPIFSSFLANAFSAAFEAADEYSMVDSVAISFW